MRELTGFSEAVLADALAPEQAWARLCATMTEQRPMPAAIHFARFELTFLRDFCERFQPDTAFPIDAVCVHAIACRLYPDLPRRNLRALAGFLGHGLHLERRSLGHVLATAFIWRKLAAELSARGIGSWAELGTWLAAKEKPATPRKRTYPLPRERCRALPDEPGVYRFLRSNGDVLYVGKATSLKKRVTSHFSKQRGATERALEMLTQVSDIAVTVSASPLEAALLETDLIKSLNPPYNVQLVQGERGAWFASVELDSAATTPDERHRLGPLPSRFSVRCLRALCELLEGEAPTVQRRAAVVGAPLAFAPDETSFAEGFAAFRERHALRLSEQRGSARARAFAIARTLLLSAAPEDAEGQSEAEEAAELDAPVWDAARVCRHLERSAAAAYQVLRRASWLCLLAESVVTFREPRARVGRSLVLQGARVVELADQGADEVVSLGPRRRRGASREAFDAARYDELRILTTELKRILRDGGEVAVRLSARRVLSGSRLASLLRLV
ncbi:MAG TPA: GIY-YIG nuclease family protein [Polyangiaceae bacterium]|nr:GIY-YIG nuclease family protein [Polyangiaceae bacterium]